MIITVSVEDTAGTTILEPDAEEIEDVTERGRLTPQEKAPVMLDLRPRLRGLIFLFDVVCW